MFIDAFRTQTWVEPLGWALLHSMWQGGVITVVTWIVIRRYGVRLRSQTRYALCCTALGLSVAVPVLTFASFILSPDRGGMVTPVSAVAPVLGVVSPTSAALVLSGGAALVLPWVGTRLDDRSPRQSTLDHQCMAGGPPSGPIGHAADRREVGAGSRTAAASVAGRPSCRPSPFCISRCAVRDRLASADHSAAAGRMSGPESSTNGGGAGSRARAHQAARFPRQQPSADRRGAVVLPPGRVVGFAADSH